MLIMKSMHFIDLHVWTYLFSAGKVQVIMPIMGILDPLLISVPFSSKGVF